MTIPASALHAGQKFHTCASDRPGICLRHRPKGIVVLLSRPAVCKTITPKVKVRV